MGRGLAAALSWPRAWDGRSAWRSLGKAPPRRGVCRIWFGPPRFLKGGPPRFLKGRRRGKGAGPFALLGADLSTNPPRNNPPLLATDFLGPCPVLGEAWSRLVFLYVWVGVASQDGSWP